VLPSVLIRYVSGEELRATQVMVVELPVHVEMACCIRAMWSLHRLAPTTVRCLFVLAEPTCVQSIDASRVGDLDGAPVVG
jgi:hypothetical protein